MDDVPAEISMKAGSGALPETDLKEAVVTLCIDLAAVSAAPGEDISPDTE